jgi:hypothetical protein
VLAVVAVICVLSFLLVKLMDLLEYLLVPWNRPSTHPCMMKRSPEQTFNFVPGSLIKSCPAVTQRENKYPSAKYLL